MSDTLSPLRQFFADEVAAIANLTTPALVDALARVPREQFLRPGPWLVQGDLSGPRRTPDADARHVYHNYSVAIDPERLLFNGSPSLVAGVIDVLRLGEGRRVLHIGAGLGYYSALIGHVVGPTGRVLAIEVDPLLAQEAALNLAPMPWVDVETGDATGVGGTFDAILVSAGVTHPQAAWLDALAPGGRLAMPLTAGIPSMGPIGKGVMTMITRRPDDGFDARVLTFVAIYSGISLRDEELNARLGQALMRTPFPPLRRLRRDPHEPAPQCWVHGDGWCLSMAG